MNEKTTIGTRGLLDAMTLVLRGVHSGNMGAAAVQQGYAVKWCRALIRVCRQVRA